MPNNLTWPSGWGKFFALLILIAAFILGVIHGPSELLFFAGALALAIIFL